MLKTSQQKYLLCPTRQGLPPCVHVSGTGTSMCILKSRGALPSPYPKAHNAGFGQSEFDPPRGVPASLRLLLKCTKCIQKIQELSPVSLQLTGTFLSSDNTFA